MRLCVDRPPVTGSFGKATARPRLRCRVNKALVMRTESDDPVVAAGYRRMAVSTVCVAALARDCAPALRANLPFVDALCGRFKRANVVVVENDSKDATKDVLRSWAAERPHITLILEDYGTVTVPSVTSGPVIPWFSRFRIEKLAAYRNRYLDHAAAIPGLDYLIAIDLDLYAFDLDGIAHAFGQSVPCDCPE